jgi:hypothetical protein
MYRIIHLKAILAVFFLSISSFSLIAQNFADIDEEIRTFPPCNSVVELAAPQAIALGVKAAAGELLTSGSDFPGKMKVMVLDIEYPIDIGDAFTAVFQKIRKNSFQAEAHKESGF